MKRSRGLILGGILGLALAAALPAVATANISVDPAFTVLYVKGDEGPNQITVECLNGLVYVDGEVAADGKASCSDLEKLAIFGFGGDDVIRVSGFDDTSDTGIASVLGSSTEHAITVYGGEGNDVLKGQVGEVALAGGPGDDRVSAGGAFLAVVAGGPGADRIGGAEFFSLLAGGDGSDQVRGGGLFTFVLAGAGDDSYRGGGHFDFAVGGRGADKLVGKAGRDVLAGGPGSDGLFGGPGDDKLGGGPGRDELHGGPGADELFQGAIPRRELRHLPSLGDLPIAAPAGNVASRLAVPAEALGR